MHLSSYTLFFISLLGALVSAAPVRFFSFFAYTNHILLTRGWNPQVAGQGSNIDSRAGGGAGGGNVDWKRATDNSSPLLR
ncbi:hypothetical protein EDB83DRAFT_589367 [Lactarius deliciosus]|nr:hypothetical protein EDB83DRAFT_589367 [Lactarius deliciosus]